MDRSHNRIKWILLISLLVNAMFVGFVIAHAMGHGFGPPPPMIRQMMGRHPEIPEKARVAMAEALRGERSALDDALRSRMEARRRIVAILRAEPLNRSELDAAMSDLRAKTLAAQEIYHHVIAKAVSGLSVEERLGLDGMLDARPGRFGPNGGAGGFGGMRRPGFGRAPGFDGPGRDGVPEEGQEHGEIGIRPPPEKTAKP